MDRKKKKDETYHSMTEFERKYLPRSLKKQQSQRPSDAETLGIALAKESINKIRELLVE